jgi:ribosomal protein S18 acetylase RimI-like enzyme
MIEVRKALKDEAPIIMEFQLKMAMETEGIKLESEVLFSGIQRVFERPELGCYYVACINQQVVASLLITYEWSDWRNKIVYWIQSVYVDKAYRRMGIYSKMYEHIKSLVVDNETIGGVRLYVDKTNHTARETYARLGMNGEHYMVFEWMK